MRTLHAIGTVFLLIGVGFFLFDLIYQFAVYKQFKILSIEDVWLDTSKDSFEGAKSLAETIIPSDKVRAFVKLPALLVILIISGIFFLPVKILSLLGVGKKDAVQ